MRKGVLMKGKTQLLTRSFLLLLDGLLALRYYLDKIIAWVFAQAAKNHLYWLQSPQGEAFLKAIWDDSPESYIKMLNTYGKACGQGEMKLVRKEQT